MEVSATRAEETAAKPTPQASDLQSWAGNWIWRAVQCLVQSPDFNASPKWIANRLNISIDKAVDAIEGLERLGFIKWEGTTYAHVEEWVQVLPNGQVSREDLLSQHSKIAPQIISKLTSNDKFTTQFFLANQDLISKYAPKFVQLYREMNEEGLKLGLTEVIASEISFAQLTTDANAGGVA